MINRYYICDNCDHHLVVKQDMHDETRLKKCPECKKNKLYQDLSGQHTFVYQEPTTLGHQAQRNTERAGKYEIQAKQKEAKKSHDQYKLEKLKNAGLVSQNAEELPEKKNPFYNPDGKNLSKVLEPVLKSPEKISKYIKNGEI